MTREEAIEELKEAIIGCEYVDSEYSDCLKVDVLRIALKSLEAWNKVIKDFCKISMQGKDEDNYMSVAIRVVNEHLKEVEE